MANQEVELFDLASKGKNFCWSLNPWKTRLVLNYKKIPYKTTWLEYPEVAPLFKSKGIPPNAEATPYTIPTIGLPDGTYVMDSKKIAAVLEEKYPSPSLHLDSPVLPELEKVFGKALLPLRGVVMPKIPRNFLNPVSVEYFERTRAERFGCSLAELEKTAGGESAWAEAEPHLKECGTLLKKNGGPFLLGETISFGDMIIIGALQYMKKMGEGVYDRVVAIEPALAKLYEASASFLVMDDH